MKSRSISDASAGYKLRLTMTAAQV